MFRKLTLGLSALSLLAMPIAAGAQSNGRGNDNRQDAGDHRDDRNGKHDDHRGGNGNGNGNGNGRGQGGGDWKTYRNYDYNRPARGQSAYYADQYYRDGSYYQPRRLGSNDRIYRGRDNRYYCRRNDGTTGLVIGALGGGVLGNSIASGGSKTLGTLLGGGLGALLGQKIDRNNVSCR